MVKRSDYRSAVIVDVLGSVVKFSGICTVISDLSDGGLDYLNVFAGGLMYGVGHQLCRMRDNLYGFGGTTEYSTKFDDDEPERKSDVSPLESEI
tara:strand:+ start:370 stop:651 length:282 start_codon:yes stop_codon:yes gene_type:complete